MIFVQCIVGFLQLTLSTPHLFYLYVNAILVLRIGLMLCLQVFVSGVGFVVQVLLALKQDLEVTSDSHY